MTEDILEETRESEAENAFLATTSKKNLSGVRGRASRTGRKGPVQTPVDFLKGKAKKEYMKNSEVEVYNMYDKQVIPYDEFKKFPVEKQVALMSKWREEVGTNNILKEFKVSRKYFYSEVLPSLGIETKPRGNNKRLKQEEQGIQIRETENSHPFAIFFRGIYQGQALSSRIAGLAGVFDSSGEYDIKIEIKEIIKH